jgi:anti-sigma factor RsiW
MTDSTQKDLLLIDRYLDGALASSELAAAKARLEAEPALRACLQERTRLRRGFVAGRAATFAAPAGFAESVVAAARRLPETGEPVEPTVRMCRRLLIAAAAVIVGVLLWRSGLFREAGNGTLQAAPDAAQRVIDALDAKIAAQPVGGARK